VKDHLDREGISYQLIDGDENAEETITAIKAAGSDILPIICYNGDNYIAGYNESNINKLIKLCKS